MGKGKKRRQEDFQKVKLKVGKRLKKGENVTNASFKTRTVQVVQQLKGETRIGPSTKKKQNLQEVITQCRHYNAHVRQEAVNGLREIVSSFPETLATHLSDILEKSAELLQDKETPVRQGSLRLFKTIFPRVAEKQISPFFSMVCAHLCCAMTHISSDIQADSLNMFDLLLEFYPKLIIRNASQVMTNFIEQISRQKGEGRRALTSNLGQKMTSVKWRTSVLGRIEKLLTAFIDYRNDRQSISVTLSDVLRLRGNERTEIQVFPSYIKNQWENPGFSLRSLNETSNVRDDLDSKFSSFIDTLIPLLLECWIEASPVSVQVNTKDDSVLIPSSVFTLSSILNVVKLLLECAECLKVDQETETRPTIRHMKDFLQRVFEGFPYSIQEYVRKESKKKYNEDEVMVTLYLLNLSICEMMSYYVQYKQVDYPDHWLSDVLHFSYDFLKSGTNASKGCKTIVRIVQRLQNSGIESDTELGLLSEVMSAMFSRFRKANSLSQEKKVYLQYFSDLVFDSSTGDKISDELQDKFLRCLPELFPMAAKENSQMAALLIQSMKVAACRNRLSFLNVEFFSKNGQLWFDDETGAITFLSEMDQRELFSLMYFVPDIDLTMIKLLTCLIRSEKISEESVSYLIQVLHNRFTKGSRTTLECSIHVSFLVNLILGNTQDLEVCDRDISLDHTLGKYHVIYTQLDKTKHQPSWTRHEFLVQEALKVIHMFQYCSQVKTLVLSYIKKYLAEHLTVSCQTAFGIYSLTNNYENSPPDNLTSLVDLGMSVLTYCVTCNPGSHGMALSSLQAAVCGFFGTVPDAFKMLVSGVEVKITEVSEENIAILLKVCLMVLTEEFRRNLLMNIEITTSLNQMINYIKNKEQKSSELETLVADLEYRCSSASFTVT